MKKVKYSLFIMLLIAILIPNSASAAWEGYDYLPLKVGLWSKSLTFHTASGTIKACISGVDNSNNTYTIDAYEDDGVYGLDKLGVRDMQGNGCTYFYNVEADGGDYAEVYFRLGLARYSDTSVKLDVYLQ